MNEKTIAKAKLDADQTLDLEGTKGMFDSASKEEKTEYREFTERQLKSDVLLYLYQHGNDGEALFNLLRGIAELGGFKEQNAGVIYIQGEFATNYYIANIPKDEERDENTFYASEVLHISYNTSADEEEVEDMMLEV